MSKKEVTVERTEIDPVFGRPLVRAVTHRRECNVLVPDIESFSSNIFEEMSEYRRWEEQTRIKYIISPAWRPLLEKLRENASKRDLTYEECKVYERIATGFYGRSLCVV